MRKKLFKILYLFTRGTSIFSLPYIRRIRVKAYEYYFGCKNLSIGESVLIVSSHYHKDASLIIGEDVSIASSTLIDYTGKVTIGKHCTISEGVKIYSHTHKLIPNILEIKKTEILRSTIEIEDYVWIGANAVILPSVKKIGKGAIIGAGSIVTKDIKAFDIVAGNPATKISTREISKKLL
jgi:acetyltransferase-like isoleucine patch superfamily enzyme